jgi:hypothetical protein
VVHIAPVPSKAYDAGQRSYEIPRGQAMQALPSAKGMANNKEETSDEETEEGDTEEETEEEEARDKPTSHCAQSSKLQPVRQI